VSSHALRRPEIAAPSPGEPAPAAAPEPGILRVLRNLDLALLALALPIVLAAGWPLAGWGAGTGLYLAQRGIKAFVERRAERSEDVRTTVGLLTGGMIGRGWLVAGSIFAVGLADEDAGLSAAVLFLAAFTLSFTMGVATRGPGPARRSA
jgi:hypothetical protein